MVEDSNYIEVLQKYKSNIIKNIPISKDLKFRPLNHKIKNIASEHEITTYSRYLKEYKYEYQEIIKNQAHLIRELDIMEEEIRASQQLTKQEEDSQGLLDREDKQKLFYQIYKQLHNLLPELYITKKSDAQVGTLNILTLRFTVRNLNNIIETLNINTIIRLFLGNYDKTTDIEELKKSYKATPMINNSNGYLLFKLLTNKLNNLNQDQADRLAIKQRIEDMTEEAIDYLIRGNNSLNLEDFCIDETNSTLSADVTNDSFGISVSLYDIKNNFDWLAPSKIAMFSLAVPAFERANRFQAADKLINNNYIDLELKNKKQRKLFI